MKLKFLGDISALTAGISISIKELKAELSDEGLAVHVQKWDKNMLEVSKKGNSAYIKYFEKIHFFRAMGLLAEALQDGDDFEIVEEPQFTMNGIMPDVSQGNAVINPDTIKKLLDKMAVMGLNMFMLYMEDSYEIDTEPYFGYMRGRYTQSELKEIDNYADALGIEVIPAIQTLAHLIDVLKWDRYDGLREDEDTLLVGEPEVYKFVERMIAAASAPLRSKRIHIGMDEAWRLGRGEYLNRNGLKDTFEIMNEHLQKVVEITEKYGLKPMIWSDMYFRTRALSGYGNNYDPDVEISEQIVEGVPDSLSMVFWEYNKDNREFYSKVIEKHRRFGKDPVFAGGIWNWMGFGVNYGITFRTTNTALDCCKQEGVKEVFATLWGDDGTENNIFSVLLGMQLFAEHGYVRKLEEGKLKKRFGFCTGGTYDDFMDIKHLDEVPGVYNDNMAMYNPSKYLLWQNISMGLYDRNIRGMGLGSHYEAMRLKMEGAIARNGDYSFIFKLLERVCAVLAIKAELGIEITDAYKEKNNDKLREICDFILPELTVRVDRLRRLHRDLWYKTNKAFGWEIIDLRYGALLMNIDTTLERITGFLDGRIGAIEELEAERLYFTGTPGLVPGYCYGKMPSASRISHRMI